MKHLFLVYIGLCAIIPFCYREPFDLTLFGQVFDGEWFYRDLLMFLGVGIAACITFIKNPVIQREIAYVIMIQSAAQVFSKLWDDCHYDMVSTVVQGLALAGSICYIYIPKRQPKHASKRS